MLPILALTVLFFTVLTELLARWGAVPYWVARKILHVIAVSSCAVATLVIDRTVLAGIVAVAEIGLVGLIWANVLMREESGRRAWGIVWFPLAFLLLLVSVNDDRVICLAMLVLALCDPLATVIGKLFPWRPFALTGDRKTWSGSLAFAAGTAVLLLIGFESRFWLHIPLYVGLLTAAEALGSKGRDNLYVPLLAAFLLLEGDIAGFLPEVLLAGAIPFFFVLRARGSLTADGALAAIILGCVVSLKAGPEWLLPLFVFLLSSSLIGKLLPVTTAAGDAKQKQARDAVQVLANGAVYGLVVICYWPKDGVLYLILPVAGHGLLAVMAIATADTWSSEIGQYFRQPTYDLVRWQPVPAGLSGGVSLAGTLAGLAGSVLLVGSCFWLLDYWPLSDLLLIVAAGFGGMLLDSVLGSLLQATYADTAGNRFDTPGADRELVSGYAWMSNDLVNLLAIFLGLLVYDLLRTIL